MAEEDKAAASADASAQTGPRGVLRWAGPDALQGTRDKPRTVPALKDCPILWESRTGNSHFHYNVGMMVTMEIPSQRKLPREVT